MKKPGVERRYSFESFTFDAATGELAGAAGTVKLRPQASLALECLVSRQGALVSREELRDVLWPDERIVMFESSIAAVMRELRRALGDDPKKPRFIETIPKRGYRFIPAAGPAQAAAEAAVSHRSRPRGFRASTGGFLNLSQGLAVALVLLLPGAVERLPPLSVQQAKLATVAVLPFENSSLLPPQIALAEVLGRDLVGRLGPAAPDALQVIDRTDARESGGAAPDFVLRGRVRDAGPSGKEAVISVRLLTGADGAFVWGEDYRRQPNDVTARELSARIAGNVLSSAIDGWENGYAGSPATDEAARHFQRGLDALGVLRTQANAEAIDAFEQVTLLEPGLSAGHARLAEALAHWVGAPFAAERVERARRAASRAVELEPRNALGLRVLGEIALFFDRDWQLAGQHLERSVTLAPSAADAHQSYGVWLSSRGRHDEALREIELAAALDPASIGVSIDAMLLHYYARDFAGTIAAARRLQQLWPETHSSQRYILLSRLATGDTAGAVAEARAALDERKAAPPGTRSAPALADSEVLQAYWKSDLDMVTRFVQEQGGDPTYLAVLHAQLGQQDAAVDALQMALAEERFSYFLPFLGVSPAYDSLCGNRGFERILRELRQSALHGESVDSRCAAAMQAAAQHRDRARR